jgi:hypothetical protein
MFVRKNICWVIVVSHDLPVRECKIFVRWKIFVRFKKYLVNARGRGQDGHFGVRPHPSELTNGANLTDYGRNGFGVKKNLAQWLGCPTKLFSGLCVRCIFFNGCVSKSPRLSGLRFASVSLEWSPPHLDTLGLARFGVRSRLRNPREDHTSPDEFPSRLGGLCRITLYFAHSELYP